MSCKGEASWKKLQIWFRFSSKLSRIVYAYTFDHLNIESLNEGLVAIDDILLTSFWFSASAICPGEDTRPAWGDSVDGAETLGYGWRFFVERTCTFLEDLRTFPVLGCIQKKKSNPEDSNNQQKKTYLSKKIQKFREFLEGGCVTADVKPRENVKQLVADLSVLPPTHLGRSKVSTYLLKKLVQNPGGKAMCHVQGVVDLLWSTQKTPEKHIIVGRHEVKISEGRLWFVINFLPFLLSNLKQI